MMTRKMRRFCLAGALALPLLGALTAAASAPAQDAPAPPPAQNPQRPAPDTRLNLDARDADARVLFQMLFDGYQQSYSLGAEAVGDATVMMAEQPLPQAVDVLTRAIAVPLTSHVKDRIWFVQAKDPAQAGAKDNPRPGRRREEPAPPEARNVLEVPRRVAAVLTLPGYASAALVNGPETSPEAQTHIVQVGSQVPAGIVGQEPLRVTQIDKKGIELTQAGPDHIAFRVPLTSRPSPTPPPKY